MANMTLAVPDELYKEMKKYNEIKWSEVARKSFNERIKEMDLLDDLRAIDIAEKEHKSKKTISHKDLLKDLGINE